MLAGRTSLIAAMAVLVTVATGCSNTNSPVEGTSSGTATATVQNGVQVVTLTTGNDLRFHPSTIVVHPGKVKVVLKNTAASGPPHNLLVTGFPADFVPTVGAGRESSATFVAPAPGSYGFVCTIHEAQGQKGTLVVEPGSP
ncbi:MAG: cupredoxin domain-containing protein [Jatrophihabitans sp.]